MKGAFSGSAKKKRQDVDIPEGAKPVKSEEFDVRLEPLRTQRTEIPTTPSEVFRLTFEDEGNSRWAADIPNPSGRSIELRLISGDSGRKFTVIHNERTSVLAIFDSTSLSDWMQDFPDSTPLSALSIPGTHNSPTYHQALPSVRCQAVSPLTQLEHGVRFFDVRIQVNDVDKGAESDALDLVHAQFPISLKGSVKAQSLFEDMYAFLQSHPSESIILSLKREGRGSGTDAIFSERLRKQVILPNANKWHTNAGVARLGEVRGKIVLLRRFALSERLQHEVQGHGGFGINATNWADNTTNHHGGDIQVQDFYTVTDTENIEKKIQYVCEHLERAGAAVHLIRAPKVAREGPTQPLFINFLSAANFFKLGCWPDKIAAKMNPAITQFLCERHAIGDEGVDPPEGSTIGVGGVGIVVCDWVGEDGDWDLVQAIVGMNSRLLVRLEQQEGAEEVVDPGKIGNEPRRGRGMARRGRGRCRERGGGGRFLHPAGCEFLRP